MEPICYKIIADFLKTDDSWNFENFISALSSYGDTVFDGHAMFFCPKDGEADKSTILSVFKKSGGDKTNCFIQELSSTNIVTTSESDFMKNWVQSKLDALRSQQIEQSNQDLLQQISQRIETLGKIVDKINNTPADQLKQEIKQWKDKKGGDDQ